MLKAGMVVHHLSFPQRINAATKGSPEGHDGLGLMLLGTTGDQVLDAETYARIKDETLRVVRGTVQADILKEDQVSLPE
jgi:hypothetical protein